jgi:hypothetical protein
LNVSRVHVRFATRRRRKKEANALTGVLGPIRKNTGTIKMPRRRKNVATRVEKDTLPPSKAVLLVDVTTPNPTPILKRIGKRDLISNSMLMSLIKPNAVDLLT